MLSLITCAIIAVLVSFVSYMEGKRAGMRVQAALVTAYETKCSRLEKALGLYK